MSRLKPCPRSPNCVSSLADPTDRTHYISPLRVDGDCDAAMSRIQEIVEGDGATIVTREPDYIHAVYTTRILRFKDDVEFEWVEPGRVDVRSASRLGHSDFGANRRRVEDLRERLER